MKLEDLQYHVICMTCEDRWANKPGQGQLFFSAFEHNAKAVKALHKKRNQNHTIVIKDIKSGNNLEEDPQVQEVS